MNARADSGAALADLRTQARQRWNQFAPRERLALAAAIALILIYVVFSIAVLPAWRNVSAAPQTLDQLEAQLQQMQRLASESRTLRAAPPVSPGQAVSALKSATDRLGGKARLAIAGDRATLALTGVSGEGLKGWLSEVRSAARARVIDAQLTRSGAQGFSGTIMVTLGGAS